MKIIVGFLLLSFISSMSFAQSKKLLQRSWIRYDVENLSGKETVEPDTLYTRYTFDKSLLYISFYPCWDDYKVNWALKENDLTISFDTYKIEELTDSSLTIVLDGFRRIKFWAEDHLCRQEKYLALLDSFSNKPVYKANNYISPRYSKHIPLSAVIQKNLENQHIQKAVYFKATFIVTDKGGVENVKVVNGVNQEFDNDVIKLLQKTSGNWIPANFKGVPIQTQTYYEIKYLRSFSKYTTEKL